MRRDGEGRKWEEGGSEEEKEVKRGSEGRKLREEMVSKERRKDDVEGIIGYE